MKNISKAAVVALALATTAAPMMAQAQERPRGDRHERYDRRDNHRGPQREWRNDRAPAPHHVRPNRPAPGYAVRWDRNNRDWWRGRPEYRDYRGMRAGYWYAPGYGYYRVDPRYRDYRWRTGAYLPAAYRTYYVSDPAFYGLRPAPRGYRYVHAGNDIVLIAVATGLITSVLSGIY